jgi:hypothetical protein
MYDKQTAGEVDVYAVFYVKVTDAAKSAAYVDAAGRQDSELALPFLVQKVLAEQAAADASKEAMVGAVKKAVASVEADMGLQLEEVEVRGIYPSSEKVLDKIRAMDEPLLAADVSGHGLAADYWAESLTPPFFESMKFGSAYEAPTPASTSLEWSIPSPPDYHHFNEVPRLTGTAPEGKH